MPLPICGLPDQMLDVLLLMLLPGTETLKPCRLDQSNRCWTIFYALMTGPCYLWVPSFQMDYEIHFALTDREINYHLTLFAG